MHRLLALALSLTAAPAVLAQSIAPVDLRIAPQYVTYRIDAPIDRTISQFSVPLLALVPLTPSLMLDLGTAYVAARVEGTEPGSTMSSDVSGLTDTQLRLTYTLGADRVVITAGVNLPTGRATADPEEQAAAGLIGSDFLSFPISNMGTGFGGTLGAAVARPIGEWNVGAGLSVRRSAAFDPFELEDGTRLRYEPGDEYRLRVGVDRSWGTGRVIGGVTYSRFGDDDIAGSIYNTGDRWLTQGSASNSIGVGNLAVNVWNLFRTAGTLADGSITGRESITNLAVAYGLALGEGRVEPALETRYWSQSDAPSSSMLSATVRYDRGFGMFGVTPAVSYSVGRIAASSGDDASIRAGLSGFRAQLAIRVR